MTDHPVTLGDLRVFIDPPVTNAQQMVTTRWTRPATVADLVSALRAEGVRSERIWWCTLERTAYTKDLENACTESHKRRKCGWRWLIAEV